ncbi:MAG: hypothetical protein JSW72_01580 [Candidatus Bathyarchaeota archaeon]|nr:MAG: hypothetical protein JSW72_01580 [Candidatus Bathyarchaeota archaeon]
MPKSSDRLLVVRKALAKTWDYFRENWGAPFVMGFMLFLIVAAIFLSIGLDACADDVAVYAYCALVVGAALQSASFLRTIRRSSSKD